MAGSGSNPEDIRVVTDFQGVIDGGGAKYDVGKNRLDLIPPDIIQALGEIYTYGAKKYADNNWLKGMKQSRIYGAVLRHMLADYSGEDKDPESEFLHLAHAFWGLGTLLFYRLRGEQYASFDDRVFRRSTVNIPTVWLNPPSQGILTDSIQYQDRVQCMICKLWYNNGSLHFCAGYQGTNANP